MCCDWLLNCVWLVCDPMDYSSPGYCVRGDSPGKNTGVGCHALLQGIFPTQGLNPGFLHCRWILYSLSHQGRPCRYISCMIYVEGKMWFKWKVFYLSQISGISRNMYKLSNIKNRMWYQYDRLLKKKKTTFLKFVTKISITPYKAEFSDHIQHLENILNMFNRYSTVQGHIFSNSLESKKMFWSNSWVLNSFIRTLTQCYEKWHIW